MVLRVLLVSMFLVSPALAATHAVPAGGDLQAAIDAAQPGDVIELAAGATYIGNFRLPVKNGTTDIVIRTGGSTRELPGPGVRINKSHAPLLAKIRSGNVSPALSTAAGAHHWRIELVEFEATSNGSGDIITLGSANQTDATQLPYELVFDRVYVHGERTTGQKRGIALNSGSTQIINSYFEDFKLVGQEAQAIAGWNGSGPYLIENNYVEAAAQSVMFGGSDPLVWNLVPSDITVRRNVSTKPLSWRSEKWLTKNGFELKNARRVLVEGNVIENVWGGGQNGYAVLFTVRNQNGRAPWSVIEDVTFRYNIIRNAGGGINVLGYDNVHTTQQTRRLMISHNLLYGIDRDLWDGTGDFVQLGGMPRDIYIEHNTVIHDGMALRVYGGKTPTGGVHIDGLVVRDNLHKHNTYGVKGDGTSSGNATIARYMPGVVFERNVLAGGPAASYPPGNYFPTVADFEAQFVNLPGANFALVAGSSFRTSATNGAALGADLTTMQRVMSGAGGAAPGLRPNPGDEGDGEPISSHGVPRGRRFKMIR
jgi:Right handed beta helix region